jgi:hypothetical protein
MRRLRPLSLLFLTTLAGCGGANGATLDVGGSDDATGHVHALGVDPADGSIYVAAHSGLFRAGPGADRASRVGDERRDVMGFTVTGPGRFAGSGHPDFRSGGPSSVGFITSADAGRSWRTVSLEGEADLHALEVAGRYVYGFDALTGRLRRSDDTGRTWQDTRIAPVLDLAIDPSDPLTVLVSTESGVLRSADGGRRFRPAYDAPPSHLVWAGDVTLAVGLDGRVRRLADGGGLVDVGRVPFRPAAATVSDGELLVAADDGRVLASQDGGASWRDRLEPAS